MNEIFHRTSIRKYLDKPVEDEKIETILQAAVPLHLLLLSRVTALTVQCLNMHRLI